MLDPKTALHSVQAENAAPSPASGGLSPLGNLRWYLGTAIPRSLTWPLVALAVVGFVLVMRKPRVPQLLPLVFCATFLVGISVSDVHQQQWVIQILPVLTLFAAFAVVALTDALTAPLPRALRKPVLTPVVLIAAAVVLALDPVTTLARADADSSTGGAARDWIVAHIPPGSRLIEDSIHVPLHDTSFHVKYRLDGPARAPIHYISFGSQYLRLDRHTHTLAFYKDAGYQYLVVNGYWVDHTASNSALYPLEAAFYRDLNCHTHLIAVFGVTTLRHGWPVRVYELNAPPPPEVSVFCGEKSSGS